MHEAQVIDAHRSAGRLFEAAGVQSFVRHGEAARRAAGVDTIHRLPAKHFLQEDQPTEVAQLVADFVAG